MNRIDRPQYIVLLNKETLVQSIVSDTYTFLWLLLFMNLSRGEGFWEFLSVVMFVLFVGFYFVKSSGAVPRHEFRNKADLVAWVNKLEERP